MKRTFWLHLLLPLTDFSLGENLFDGLDGLRFVEVWNKGGVQEDICLSLSIRQAIVGAVELGPRVYVLPRYSKLKAVKLGVLRIQFASHILLDNFQRVHKIGHGCREIIRRPGGLGELPQPFSIIGLPIIGHED